MYQGAFDRDNASQDGGVPTDRKNQEPPASRFDPMPIRL
jgi:hypothetical protein